MFGDTFSSRAKSRQMILGNALNTTLPALTTLYLTPGTTEPPLVIPFNLEITTPCILTNQRITITSPQPVSGNLKVTLMLNNVPQSMFSAIFVAGGGSPQTITITESIQFKAGDLLCFEVANYAAEVSANISRHSLLALFY